MPPDLDRGKAVFGNSIGYVQRIHLEDMQSFAEEAQVRIEVAALPGTFAAPGRALAYVRLSDATLSDIDSSRVEEAFVIDRDRTYSEDPRFGLIALSEIASRALSPAVNDPGTAIDVIGALVRLFAQWAAPTGESAPATRHDRVAVPELSLADMFDDAFGAIARDGAGTVEVIVRLLKALESLASIDHPSMKSVAEAQARTVLARAEAALSLPADLDRVRRAARFAGATRVE